MKLLKRIAVGTGFHRSGWPSVMSALQQVASRKGLLLDDFVDATFSFLPLSKSYNKPWVGIFHHPVRVHSPIPQDKMYALRCISNHPLWAASQKNLRGAIALCDEVAEDLRRWLSVPVVSIRHPTETNVSQWRSDAAIKKRQIVQAGFFLRNTRVIYQIAPPSWRRIHLINNSSWYHHRDTTLQLIEQRPEIGNHQVEILAPIDDRSYDLLLSDSVVIAELYGAAANNIIVECMVRGTPILVNRMPAVEEYLGKDYPLFYDDLSQISERLRSAKLNVASQWLVKRARLLPSFDQFAEQVNGFVNSLESTKK